MKWKTLCATALAGMMLLAAGCGGSDNKAADSKAAPAEQSLKGKKLVMYVSFHEDTAKALAEGFKKATGAEVVFIRLPTGEAVARMTAEKDSPKAVIKHLQLIDTNIQWIVLQKNNSNINHSGIFYLQIKLCKH